MELKVITEPSIYLVGKTECVDFAVDNLLHERSIDPKEWYDTRTNEEAALLAETGGRLCYMSFDKPRDGGSDAYFKHIKQVGHYSIFEHNLFTFIFAGVSRSLTHELVRHRHFSFSQLSQRYVDESDTAFVLPPKFISSYLALKGWKHETNYESLCEATKNVKLYKTWQDSCELSLGFYKELVEELLSEYKKPYTTEQKKSCREAARSVLPNCTETIIQVSGNARAWRHFLHLRASAAADAEINRLAIKVLDILQKESPLLFNDFIKEQLDTRIIAYSPNKEV